MTEYKKSKEGVMATIYAQQRSSSKKRGHSMPDYTSEQFRDKYINDTLFIELHFQWEYHGYQKEMKPSFDRNRDDKPYSFSNIMLTTWGQNDKKQRFKISHQVVQSTYEGIEIELFNSIRSASKVTGINRESIRKACKNDTYKAGGFKWQYA